MNLNLSLKNEKDSSNSKYPIELLFASQKKEMNSILKIKEPSFNILLFSSFSTTWITVPFNKGKSNKNFSNIEKKTIIKEKYNI